MIRYATVAMKNNIPRELDISTQLENGQICVKIQNRGVPISDDMKRLLLDEAQGYPSSLGGTGEGALLCAFSVLRKWGAVFDVRYENGLNTIIVLIPPCQVKNQVED
jgi:signal transduction histidine kinase